jgi:hypothetical protein
VTIGLTQVGPGRNGDLAAALILPGIPLYLLGPPFVHVAHGRYRVGVLDALLRLAAPLLTMVTLQGFLNSLGPSWTPCDELGTTHCAQPISFPWIAVIAGSLGAAAAIDATWLAREPADSPRAATVVPSVRWSPFVGATPGGGRTFGVVDSL